MRTNQGIPRVMLPHVSVTSPVYVPLGVWLACPAFKINVIEVEAALATAMAPRRTDDVESACSHVAQLIARADVLGRLSLRCR
jgi:hypothetical protein